MIKQNIRPWAFFFLSCLSLTQFITEQLKKVGVTVLQRDFSVVNEDDLSSFRFEFCRVGIDPIVDEDLLRFDLVRIQVCEDDRNE